MYRLKTEGWTKSPKNDKRVTIATRSRKKYSAHFFLKEYSLIGLTVFQKKDKKRYWQIE